MKKGRTVIWMRVQYHLRGLILGCTTDFLCNWVLCNCLHPIFPVSADLTDRDTGKPNMLISWRAFVSVQCEVLQDWTVLSINGRCCDELSLYVSEGKRFAFVGNGEPVITIFYLSSKQKPHLVFRGQNIHVKGHALHIETEHGHKSESCTSQMNILPASCYCKECGRASTRNREYLSSKALILIDVNHVKISFSCH